MADKEPIFNGMRKPGEPEPPRQMRPMKTESPEIPKPEPTEESKLEVTFPPPVRKSKQYVEGFDKGQEDAKAEKDEANLTGKSDDFREGYNDGYKSV